MASWSRSGLPVVTALIDDTATLLNPLTPTDRAAAARQLTVDLARARSMAAPPGPGAALWRAAIADLSVGSPDRVQLAVAEADLVALNQAVAGSTKGA